MDLTKRSTQPLVEALIEYDRGLDRRNADWQKVDSAPSLEACKKADAEALHKVRLAFYEVTKDRNSLESAMQVDISFMRKIAALGEI